MPDYRRLAATASRLIAGSGAPATLIRKVNADYSASSGEVLASEKKHACNAVRQSYRLADVDGTLIQFGDARFLVDPGAPQPAPGDRLLFDDEYWNVIACEPQKPATTVLYYDVQGRK